MPLPDDADEHARFPVGRFAYDVPNDPAARTESLATLAAVPADLGTLLAGASDTALDTPYREGGWTARQVVHHLADSHTNAVVRVRLALTEDAPTIRPYAEARWAELPDARTLAVAPSLAVLDGTHARWVALLATFGEREWARTFVHPERGRAYTLDEATQLYAWHSRHHLAHVARAFDRCAGK